jgi:hypothetical protein
MQHHHISADDPSWIEAHPLSSNWCTSVVVKSDSSTIPLRPIEGGVTANSGRNWPNRAVERECFDLLTVVAHRHARAEEVEATCRLQQHREKGVGRCDLRINARLWAIPPSRKQSVGTRRR